MDDIYVSRLMTTEPLTVAPDASLEDAAATMHDEGVSSVVVTDDDGRLVGILTTTDFVRTVAEGLQTDGDEPTTVADHMTTDVVTVGVQEPIDGAASTMIEEGFHHLPVVDDDGGLVGIVSTTDLAAYVSRLPSPGPS